MIFSKQQFSGMLFIAACLLHITCFNWAVNPDLFLLASGDPTIFWQYTLPSISGEENTLYLLYDWSYGVFQGINFLFTIFGIIVPVLLTVAAGIIYWNDHQQRSKQQTA